MHKKLIGISAVLIASFVLTGCTQVKPGQPTQPSVNTPTDAPSAKKAVSKVVAVTGNNFSYDVKEIRVKKGDVVQIDFKNDEGFHDWVLDEFNVKTKQYQAGGSETVTFEADKVGTFEYYCSVGKHREMGMVGKLIVE